MSYCSAYYGTKPVVGLTYGSSWTPWTRPLDWERLPVLGPEEQRMVAIYGVENNDSNYVSILANATGTGAKWEIDWGDGTVDTGITPNTQKDHWYDWNNPALGQAKSDGSKHALVSLTVTPGAKLTIVNFNRKHGRAGLPVGMTVNWLDIAINGPSITYTGFSGDGSNGVTLSNLRFLDIGVVKISSCNYMFRNLRSLVSFPRFATTEKITGAIMMFYGCTSVRILPMMDFSELTDGYAAFSHCVNMTSFPQFNLSKLTRGTMMFYGCTMLRSANLHLPELQTGETMFRSCQMLENVVITGLSKMTSGKSMFSSCVCLRSVSLPGLAMLTDATSMFGSSPMLRSIATGSWASMASAATLTTTFVGDRNLLSFVPTGLRFSFNIKNCMFSRDGLVALFNALGNADGGAQTIYLGGNHGIADLTDDDKAIATSRGWVLDTTP